MSEEKHTQNKVTLVEEKLWKIIHAEGDGDLPQKGQQVHALYRGTLQNGTQFDSNQSRDSPFKFTLGQGQVIKGWDEGFASMRKGEKATLICSPQYAYGARGSPPRIPPNSTLHFEVELLDFNDKKKQKWDLSTQEKVAQATKLKNQGNQHLKNNQLSKAISKYTDGIQFVDGQQEQQAKSILKVLRMNLSQAYLKAKNYSKSIQNSSKVLKDDPNNVKTLYRRGVAYLNNQDFDLSKADLQKLLSIDPENVDAKQQLIRLAQVKKAVVEKERNLMKGMFSKGGLYDDKKVKQTKKKQTKQKDDTDSQNQQMPELEKDDQGKKSQQTASKSQQSHHHHGENCC